LGPLTPGGLQLSISSLSLNTTGPGGTLTFSLNGQVVASWDTTDTRGNIVPNGFYHFIITQSFSDGTQTVMERSLYIAPHSQTAQIQLSALPNIAHSNDTIHLTGVLEGSPVNGPGVIKIYDITQQLLKTLDMSNGQVDWDVTDKAGQKLASGLYFIVLDVTDPVTGSEAHKIVKVVVLR
jgi:flagellar hook assembly protein FlgD